MYRCSWRQVVHNLRKQRIYSDTGHLCNEDCAAVLDQIVTEKTKMIILAHLSEQANTRKKALDTTIHEYKIIRDYCMKIY